MTTAKFKKGDECTVCHKAFLKPVLYGMPTMDVFEGNMFIIGGCIMDGDDPDFGCQNCGTMYWKDGRTDVGELPI